MASLIRRVTAEFAFKDAGFVQGMKDAGGAVGKFGTESALGIKTGDTLSQTLGNAGKAMVGATLAAAGLTGGIAAVVLAFSTAAREVAAVENSMLRLKSAVGGNTEEFARFKAVIDSSPRGLIFDDDAVANSAAIAATLDMTADEFERLLPSVRGMAASTGDLAGAFQNVSLALETGALRSLRQYGISQQDAEKIAQKYYGEELKNLDEVAKRWVVLQAVLDKTQLFKEQEIEKVKTLGGFLSAVNVEIGEMTQATLTPGFTAFNEFIKSISASAESQGKFLGNLESILTVTQQFSAAMGPTLGFPTGAGASAALARLRQLRAGTQSIGVGSREPVEWGADTSAPGGLSPEEKARREAAAREAREKAAKEARDTAERVARENERAQREEERNRRAALRFIQEWEAEGIKIHEDAIAQKLALDTYESEVRAQLLAEQQARAVNYAQAFYGIIDRASLAFFNKEHGRQKNWAKIGAAAAQEAFSAWAKTKQQEAVIEAGRSALFAVQFAARGMIGSAAALASNAAQWGAAAVGYGLVANRFESLAQNNLSGPSGDGAIGNTGGGSSGRSGETQRRGFGLTFTRPVENLTINVAVAISGTNFIGSNHEGSVADMMEQYGIPAVKDALDAGRLAA